MLAPEKIWKSAQLPTLPSVAVKLLELSRDPETEIAQVVETIKSDPAIAAKILKATNSSFFGFKSQVASLERAVPLLGTTVVTSLALTFSLVDSAMSTGAIGQHYQAYWRQSVVQALTAELISKRLNSGLDCELFLAGLLCDLGRLVLLKATSEEYLPVLDSFADEQVRTLTELEAEALGLTHVEIGVQLMEQWALPNSLIQAVAAHHETREELEQIDGDDGVFARAVAVAAAIGDYFCTQRKFKSLDHLRQLSGAFLQLTDGELNDFVEDVKQRVDEVAQVFSVDPSHLGDPADLLAEANEQLAQLALAAQVATTQAEERQRVMEREREELQHRNEELQKRVLHDPLTRCYNRSFLDDALQREIERSQRSASPIGVVFVDIDHFKSVNDTYGHPFGDQVLIEVSQILQGSIRGSDVLARYGGEEFVVIASQPTENGLQKVAERLRARVEEHEVRFGEQQVPITISVGAALGLPNRNEEEFLQRIVTAADEAMYDSKRNGRNRVTYRSLLSLADQQLIQLINQHRFSRWLVGRGVIDIPRISQAIAACTVERQLLGQLAVERRVLTQSQVDTILTEQKSTAQRFGDIARAKNWLTTESLAALLALQAECAESLLQQLLRLELLTAEVAEPLLQEYLAMIDSCLQVRNEELAATSW